MGIVSKMIGYGIFAGAGFGIGYYTNCNDAGKDGSHCRVAYEQGLKSLEESAKGIKMEFGVASPSDLKLDYVVSSEHKFNGLVFTDVASGKQGVITKQTVLGEPFYGFSYVTLGNTISSAQHKIIEPGLCAKLDLNQQYQMAKASISELLEEKFRRVFE